MQEFLRIRNIAKQSDNELVLFQDTPIYLILCQRKVYCRIIIDGNKPIGMEEIQTLKFFEDKLKEYFCLSNTELSGGDTYDQEK